MMVQKEDTWWIENPRILGSNNPTTAALEQLRRDGFDVLVSLLIEEEQAPNYDLAVIEEIGFVRHNIPVRDFNPPTVEQLVHFISILRDLNPENKLILHCQAGIGRTGTFAAAYWMSKGMSLEASVVLVRKLRWGAIQTTEQEAILKRFASMIH
jgi:atypical dual specificity phosphatase